MKNLSILVGIWLVVAMVVPSMAKAQGFNGFGNFSNSSNSLYSENAVALNTPTPDSPTIVVPQASTEYAIAAAIRAEGTHAGVEMNDSKAATSMTTASTGSGSGFQDPSVYSEYKFAHIQDNRVATAGGFDGAQNSGIAGFDFVSLYDTVVGFNFTYTNADLSTSTPVSTSGSATVLDNTANSYFVSTYVAKNFADWVNVGASGTYGRTDSDFQLQGVGGFTQSTTQDTCALSPFVGISHTWGAFSFSSTPTYIWGYDHFSFNSPVPTGGPPPPDAKTLNQTFLWLNNFQYAVTDKLSLSIQVNWTRLVSTQSVPVAAGTATPDFSHQWMSFGGRADYSFNKSTSVFGAFEHDAFATHYDDYRIRTGVTYNF